MEPDTDPQPVQTRSSTRHGFVMSALRTSVALALAVVMFPAIVRGQRGSLNDNVPTAIEQALMEHACRVPGQARSAQDAYDACLAAELAALRDDFGRDLGRLAAKDRRRVDAACADLRIMRGRDAYIACLSDELRAIRKKDRKAVTAEVSRGSATEAPEPASSGVASLPPSVDAVTTQAPPDGGRPWSLWLAAVGLLVGAGGGGWWFLRRRPGTPVRSVCRECGADTDGHGDLCGQCRHQAAETQRRAITERSVREQALIDEARRAQEAAERQATQAAEAERARQALAREAELAKQQEAARLREEETRRWQQTAAAALAPPPDEQEIDPYAVLDVSPTASEVEIHFAYQEAIAKYAPDQVAHLGEELRNLYTAKARIVQRAYEMLTTPAQAG